MQKQEGHAGFVISILCFFRTRLHLAERLLKSLGPSVRSPSLPYLRNCVKFYTVEFLRNTVGTFQFVFSEDSYNDHCT